VNHRRFTIDLATCTGCQACRIACKDRAGLPDDLEWLRIEAQESDLYPYPRVAYRVVHCFHCANAPCMAVCPTQAIVRRAEGLVVIEAECCVGCRACVSACPFGAIIMRARGEDQLGNAAPEIASKCDGCVDEIARGLQPTCVRACPMRALDYTMVDELPRLRVADEQFGERNIGPAVLYLCRSSGA
jgi:anaerobic dimethyl sulfoxide reductase subunit B (iron-sulfur subunit)